MPWTCPFRVTFRAVSQSPFSVQENDPNQQPPLHLTTPDNALAGGRHQTQYRGNSKTAQADRTCWYAFQLLKCRCRSEGCFYFQSLGRCHSLYPSGMSSSAVKTTTILIVLLYDHTPNTKLGSRYIALVSFYVKLSVS